MAAASNLLRTSILPCARFSGYKSLLPPLPFNLSPTFTHSFSPLRRTPTLAPERFHRSRLFSTTPVTMSPKSQPFLDAIKERRTIYALNDKAPISDDEIIAIAKEVVLHVPSSFNSQSARLVVLLKDDHKKFWDFVKEALKPLVPTENFGQTEAKLNGFKAGYGTVLFFEDNKVVEGLQAQFALYSSYFPQWSEHTSAMHQFALWSALTAEGFGANLQHYNPVVDDKVQAEWNVPKDWTLKAQLVFGGKAGEAGEKVQKPIEERLIVHGK